MSSLDDPRSLEEKLFLRVLLRRDGPDGIELEIEKPACRHWVQNRLQRRHRNLNETESPGYNSLFSRFDATILVDTSRETAPLHFLSSPDTRVHCRVTE